MNGPAACDGEYFRRIANRGKRSCGGSTPLGTGDRLCLDRNTGTVCVQGPASPRDRDPQESLEGWQLQRLVRRHRTRHGARHHSPSTITISASAHDCRNAIMGAYSGSFGRLKVDGDWVLRHLVELADVDLADLYGDGGELLDLREMPEDAKRLLAGLDMTEEFEGRGPDRRHVGRTKKLRLVDRLKVLELIGKHVDVSAFKENERAGEPLVIIRDYTGRIINNANDATPPLADKKPASLPAPALPADPDTSNETPDVEVHEPAPASTAPAREPKKVETWSIQRPSRSERQNQAEM